MLIYTGTMAGISDSVIEAAEIDGTNAVQEFFYIVVPSIFPTFSLFIITGMLTIFNGQAGLFSFYGLSGLTTRAEFTTFGYYMYVKVQQSVNDYTQYPYLASLGLALSFIAIPLIFTARWLLNKFGPTAD